MAKPAHPHVAPHPFVPGPADEQDTKGRTACRRCNVVGEPGDAHHTLPEPVADARSAAAGEKGDEA